MLLFQIDGREFHLHETEIQSFHAKRRFKVFTQKEYSSDLTSGNNSPMLNCLSLTCDYQNDYAGFVAELTKENKHCSDVIYSLTDKISIPHKQEYMHFGKEVLFVLFSENYRTKYNRYV